MSRWRKAQYLREDELLVVEKSYESISLPKGLELQTNRPRNRNIHIDRYAMDKSASNGWTLAGLNFLYCMNPLTAQRNWRVWAFHWRVICRVDYTDPTAADYIAIKTFIEKWFTQLCWQEQHNLALPKILRQQVKYSPLTFSLFPVAQALDCNV